MLKIYWYLVLYHSIKILLAIHLYMIQPYVYIWQDIPSNKIIEINRQYFIFAKKYTMFLFFTFSQDQNTRHLLFRTEVLLPIVCPLATISKVMANSRKMVTMFQLYLALHSTWIDFQFFRTIWLISLRSYWCTSNICWPVCPCWYMEAADEAAPATIVTVAGVAATAAEVLVIPLWWGCVKDGYNTARFPPYDPRNSLKWST